MSTGFKLVGALGGLLMATSALAVTPLQTTVSVSPANTTTTSTSTASVTASNNTQTASASISQTASGATVAKFDTATGILVGASVTVNTPVSTNTQVLATVSGSGNRTATTSSTQTGTVSIAGLTFSSGAISGTRSCSGGNCSNSVGNSIGNAAGTISGTQTVASGNLASLAGTGSATFSRSASGTVGISANTSNASGTITARGLADFSFGTTAAGAGTYSITYDWLNFANPSLNGTNSNDLTLDFGTLTQNSAPVTLNFTIYNIGNANSANLKLTSIGRQLNSNNFTTTLATFNGLAGGGTLNYSVTFNPILLGLASEQFKLDFSDDVPGGIGMRNYTLNLFANANVVAAAIPEAKTWLMMIIGFGLVGMVRRRTGRNVVAA